MKRLRMVLLTVSVSLGMLLVILCTIAGRSTSTMAAPRSEHASRAPLQELAPSMYQAVYCTLASTTTDSLGPANNYTYTNAVPVADYNGLALAVGDVPTDPISAPASDDWFRLDNATINATFSLDAIPDGATNYNLGITVYDKNLTPIFVDATTENHTATVEFVADSYGPYYFQVLQLSSQCTGGTYHLDYSVEPPSPPLYIPIILS